MKKMLVAILFSAPFILGAENTKYNHHDFGFNQERMIVDKEEVFLVSTFNSMDGLTVYNFKGERLWEVPFHSVIQSIDVQPNIVLVFSKDRKGVSTYLTCINRVDGKVLWEKP